MKLVVFLSCLLIASLTMADISFASDWTEFQKDSCNSGLTCDRAPITTPSSMSWNRLFSGEAVDCPSVVVDDILYMVFPGGNVSAIEKNRGSVVWSTTIEQISYQLGSPAYGNGTLFIPRENGKVYALDSLNGELIWETDQIGNWLYTPIVYDSHRIYFGDCLDKYGNDGTFYCYTDTGDECWSKDAASGGGYYWAGPAVVEDFVIFVDSKGYLTSLDKDDGSLIDEVNVSEMFSIDDAGEFKSSVSYDSDSEKLFLTSKGGYCYSISFDQTGSFNVYDSNYAQLDGACTSTPSFFNGRVYVGCGGWTEGKLYCLDESDLSEIWNFETNAGVKASPAISRAYDGGDGEVYIYFTTNCADGTVYCLKDYPGNTEAMEQWNYLPSNGMNNYILQGVVISDGWLFFGNDGGYLFGLANSQSVKEQHVFADFEVNVTYGDFPLTVQFTDTSSDATSWSWDVDGDGIEDYGIKDPVHTYNKSGSYNVSLTAGNSVFIHTRTVEDCISVDWNPWNDPDSESGNLISQNEVMTAISYWKSGYVIPDTDHRISQDEIMLIVSYWKSKYPM